jgi:delta8-fatty-acid desaturase
MAAIASTGAVSGVEAGKKQQRTYPLMSRREIEALIAEGRSITIVNQHVLKVDAWIKYHPGGHLAIAHMVGRDATDEVTVFVLTLPPHHWTMD